MNLEPVWISLKTGCISILITFFFGVFIAYLVGRIQKESIKIMVDGLLTLPLVLPPTVMGFFLLMIFGKNGPLGKLFISLFGIKIAFSWLATVISAVAISFPLMYRSSKAAFESVDEDMVSAARTLGMKEWTIFRRIIIPNSLEGLVSGTILAFTRGLGEFGATAMLAGNIAGKTQTLPLAIYSEVAAGNVESAFPYVGIMIGICLLAVLVMNTYQVRVQRKRKNL